MWFKSCQQIRKRIGRSTGYVEISQRQNRQRKKNSEEKRAQQVEQFIDDTELELGDLNNLT